MTNFLEIDRTINTVKYVAGATALAAVLGAAISGCSEKRHVAEANKICEQRREVFNGLIMSGDKPKPPSSVVTGWETGNWLNGAYRCPPPPKP